MKHDGYNEFRQRGRFDFPIEIHHVDRHHPRFYMPYPWNMEYEIDLVVRGSVTLTLNESQVHAEAGDIIFIRDGVVHGGHPETTDTIYDCIVFDMKKMLAGSHTFQDRIEDVLKHVTLINKYLPASTPDIPRLIQHLFRSMKEEHTGYELVVTGLLYTFFGFIFQQGLYHEAASRPLREHRRKRITQLKQTFPLIESQYQQPLTLTDLARAANLSPNYFCRFFQKITHHSPIDYLNRYRIEMACLKLTHTNDSITEIAFSCGFNDVSYFIRLFRRYKETSPRKYKQLMKEGK